MELMAVDQKEYPSATEQTCAITECSLIHEIVQNGIYLKKNKVNSVIFLQREIT